MKKNILVSLIVVLMCFGLGGCGSKNEEQSGESFSVSLYTNSSAKITWDYELSEDGIVDISSEYDDSGCDADAAGCGGQEIYTITAQKPGNVTLSFTSSENETAIYEITVNEDLTISILNAEKKG